MNNFSIRRRVVLLLLAAFVSCVVIGEAQAAPGQTTGKTSVSSKSKRRAVRRRTRRRANAAKPATITVDAPLPPMPEKETVRIDGPPTADTTPPPTPRRASNPGVISGGVLNGKAISKPAPAYPPIAKAARASGAVTVQITVDESGRVISAHAISGHPLLQQAAVDAVRNWRFTPTLLSGQPVKITGVVTVNFNLQ